MGTYAVAEATYNSQRGGYYAPPPRGNIQQIIFGIVNLVLILGCFYCVKTSIEKNDASNMQMICIGEGILGGIMVAVTVGAVIVWIIPVTFLFSAASQGYGGGAAIVPAVILIILVLLMC